MTRLEEEIEKIIIEWLKSGNENASHLSHLIAESSKRYIEKAMFDFYVKYPESTALVGGELIKYLLRKEQWLKDNGITE
jgi:hypothetical protein